MKPPILPHHANQDPVSDDLTNWVYYLATLPEHPPILLTTVNEKKIFRGLRHRYTAFSLWLRHLLLGEPLAEELFLTNMKHYEPIAELMAAEFRLAVGVHPRSTNPLIREFESPADLWFCCQWVMANQCLDESLGLTELPKPEGKRKSIEEGLKLSRLLSDSAFPYEEETSFDLLTGILLMEAQEIAKTDIGFKLDYFSPYLRVFKRTGTKMKNCKHLQSVWLLPDGRLWWTSQGGVCRQL